MCDNIANMGRETVDDNVPLNPKYSLVPGRYLEVKSDPEIQLIMDGQ